MPVIDPISAQVPASAAAAPVVVRQTAVVLATALLLTAALVRAQSPTPPLPPNMNLPALGPPPTQRSVPPGPTPPNGPAVQVTAPEVPPLAGAASPPDAPAPQITAVQNGTQQPRREDATGLAPRFLGFLGPFRRPSVPELFPGNQMRLNSLIRDGKLYITLQDALALALENNLDVETARDNIILAHTDEVRASGGGALRGIDFNIQEPPNGVGGPGSPLLNALTTNSNPTTPTVTDLTSLNSTTQTQQSLSELSTGFTYAQGQNVPLFDPQVVGEASYLRRSHTVSQSQSALGAGGVSTGAGTSDSGGVVISPNPLNFITLNVGYLQGFSTGAQLTAIVNNESQVIFGSRSGLDPFHLPSTSVTLSQPLLRGRGRDVNLRYLRIAQINKKVSRLLFEQQVLETVYGASRIYFDLVSLGENVVVQQESLRAATKQRQDYEEQVNFGTLAPIDLTQAKALESSSRFALIQAQGLYRQQEIILRNQLLRTASPVFTSQFSEIVPTDRIIVPDQTEPRNVGGLVQQALARRPDLAQAQLQIQTGKISVNASRNNALSQLNLYANVETRGSNEQPFDTLGSIGTGLPTTPTNLAAGSLDASTIYQAGVQLTLPVRNRVAASDAARDTVQLRQVNARIEKLAAQVRVDVETAVVALETAEEAYRAASASRDYQVQLLDGTRDALSVGQSTDLAVLQNEAYFAQARSTEIAARSDYMKARIELDHALGDLLDKNSIVLDDAVSGTIH